MASCKSYSARIRNEGKGLYRALDAVRIYPGKNVTSKFEVCGSESIKKFDKEIAPLLFVAGSGIGRLAATTESLKKGWVRGGIMRAEGTQECFGPTPWCAEYLGKRKWKIVRSKYR